MKKWFVLLLGLLLFSFVIAANSPYESGNSYSDSSGDVEKVGGVIKQLPIDESGEFYFGKYQPFVTKAEVRIASINLWLDENVGWMRYIFHMKPAISWLFFINVYVILWFFVALFLNAEGLWFFVEKKAGARVFGFSVFVILMVARLYYGLASVFYSWALYFFTTLAESALWIAVIFVVLCVVLPLFGIGLISAILAWWEIYRVAKENLKRKMESDSTNKAMNALIDQIKKD